MSSSPGRAPSLRSRHSLMRSARSARSGPRTIQPMCWRGFRIAWCMSAADLRCGRPTRPSSAIGTSRGFLTTAKPTAGSIRPGLWRPRSLSDGALSPTPRSVIPARRDLLPGAAVARHLEAEIVKLRHIDRVEGLGARVGKVARNVDEVVVDAVALSEGIELVEIADPL